MCDICSYGKDDLSYTQSVPKFLQPYGHLLKKGDRPKPRKRVDVEDEGEEQEDEGDAVRGIFCCLRRHAGTSHQ